MNFVISHSSWEASKTKSSKTNRWIIILTNYQTWAGRLQFFWYINLWISDCSTFKTELQNSLLSNINDDGENNEKTKNLKTQLGIFKNMGGNIPGGNFPGGNFPGGVWWVGIFRVGVFQVQFYTMMMPVYNYFLLNRNFMLFFPFISYVVMYKMLCFFWRFCVIISFLVLTPLSTSFFTKL